MNLQHVILITFSINELPRKTITRKQKKKKSKVHLFHLKSGERKAKKERETEREKERRSKRDIYYLSLWACHRIIWFIRIILIFDPCTYNTLAKVELDPYTRQDSILLLYYLYLISFIPFSKKTKQRKAKKEGSKKRYLFIYLCEPVTE